MVMHSFMGMSVHLAPECPVYELPAEVLPGVPWQPGFRDDFNAWALRRFGTRCAVPIGKCLVLGGKTMLVRRGDFERLEALR
jgi:hypothetical protein